MAITKTNVTTIKVNCSKCKHTMELQGNVYVCPNCGNEVPAELVNKSLHNPGTTVHERTKKFKFVKPYRPARNPLNEEESKRAIAQIRKTGNFAIYLGIIDLAILAVIFVAQQNNGHDLKSAAIVLSLLPAILILASGLKIRQISKDNAHLIERILEITGFSIAGFLGISLARSSGAVYAYPLLPLLLVGSITKSITVAKSLQNS